jgi:hypothetical protein
MPQEFHACLGAIAVDVQHVGFFQTHEPRVHQVEGNGKTRDAVGAEPAIRQPAMRTKAEAAIFQIVPQGIDFFLDFAACQDQTQIAYSGVEQTFVGPAGPGYRRCAPCPRLFAPRAGF